jgi:hypothetical protein
MYVLQSSFQFAFRKIAKNSNSAAIMSNWPIILINDYPTAFISDETHVSRSGVLPDTPSEDAPQPAQENMVARHKERMESAEYRDLKQVQIMLVESDYYSLSGINLSATPLLQ